MISSVHYGLSTARITRRPLQAESSLPGVASGTTRARRVRRSPRPRDGHNPAQQERAGGAVPVVSVWDVERGCMGAWPRARCSRASWMSWGHLRPVRPDPEAGGADSAAGQAGRCVSASSLPGVGRGPEVEFRVELAPEAFHVQQGLLEQHQLGLDFHLEAPGHLKEPQQEVPKGDVLQGPGENGLADGADRRFEFIDARVRRHPAGLHMEHRDLVVVAFKESKQVARQVVLVGGSEGAHDTEIQGDVLGVGWVAGVHEDIARVHVRVEEAVPEDLGEENFHPFSASTFMSTPASRSAWVSPMGMPLTRSMVTTRLEV